MGPTRTLAAAKTLIAAFVGLCTVLAALSQAYAQPSEEERKIAGKYYKQAAEAYSTGDYDQAIEYLDKAFALDSDPVILYNLGRSHEGAGHLDQAEEILTRVQSDPKTPDELRTRVTTDLKRLSNLKAGLIQLGQLAVTSTPAGARLFVDGQVEGQTPFAGNFEVGKHKLLIQLDGYQSAEQEVDIVAKQMSEVDVALIAMGGGAGGDSGGSGLAIASYVSLGVGAIGIATGVGTYFAADAKLTDLKKFNGTDASAARKAKSDGETLALVSNIAYGVGFAGVGVGAALLVWSLMDTDSDEQASLAPQVVSIDPRGGLVFGWTW